MLYKTRRRAQKHTMPEVSLTPLIDTALVLLVIFMVATPAMYNSIKVDLPKGNAQEVVGTASPDLVVYIDKNEQIFLNDQSVTLDTLIPRLQEAIGTQQDKKVFVNADETITYKALYTVVDTIKYVGGVEHVVLSAERAR